MIAKRIGIQLYLTRRRKRRRGRERGRRRRTPPALWGTTVRTATKVTVHQRTVSNGIEEIEGVISDREVGRDKKGSGKLYEMFGKR
jgi:hypothetical protein